MIQCGHRTHNQTTEKTKTEKTPTQQDLSEKDVFHFICSFIILVACGGNKTNNKISGTWILSFFACFYLSPPLLPLLSFRSLSRYLLSCPKPLIIRWLGFIASVISVYDFHSFIFQVPCTFQWRNMRDKSHMLGNS